MHIKSAIAYCYFSLAAVVRLFQGPDLIVAQTCQLFQLIYCFWLTTTSPDVVEDSITMTYNLDRNSIFEKKICLFYNQSNQWQKGLVTGWWNMILKYFLPWNVSFSPVQSQCTCLTLVKLSLSLQVTKVGKYDTRMVIQTIFFTCQYYFVVDVFLYMLNVCTVCFQQCRYYYHSQWYGLFV